MTFSRVFSFYAPSYTPPPQCAAGGSAGAGGAARAAGLLLTQRSPRLRKHAGQVAFPGGPVDDTDASLIAAALREAQEEVAIPPSPLRLLACCRRSTASPGFRSRRLWGLSPDLHYHASEDEVASVFEMPLAEALRLGRYHPLDIHRRAMPTGSGSPGISIILSGA
jgi:8-oxo-dGTP pyrophosphatase MutT (NUDIX family)